MFYINIIILIFTCIDNVVKLKIAHNVKLNLYILVYVFYRIFGDPYVRTAVVDLEQGSVRGQYSYEFDYKMYLGIPYASVPERFQPPAPPQRWSGIKEATQEGETCAQVTILPANHFTGSEDCLFLNVYTPNNAPKDAKLPVMVFIHGGGFRYGSGDRDLYSPNFLVKHDVIVVTINYRLGIFGFLCLGIDGAYGNAGLKDQLEALKWIRSNIAEFGGDEDNVTLFGESAGAAAVSFHILAPKSSGFFKRAIIQSGTPLGPWAFSYHPLDRANEIQTSLNTKPKNPRDLLNVFKNMSTRELADASGELHIAKLPFKPCAEEPNDSAFLTEAPAKTLRSGNFTKVPIIAGFNNAEGLFFSQSKPISSVLGMQYHSIDFKTQDNVDKVLEKVDKFYFKDKEDPQAIINYYSDVLINGPSVVFYREILAKSNEPLYNYYFTYNGYRNFAKLITLSYQKGASHADELFYLFELYKFFWKPLQQDQKVIDTMTRLWTNFAKYGDPTPNSTLHENNVLQWKQSKLEELNFLQIDSELKMIEMPAAERIHFWSDIFEEFGFKM